MERLTIDIPDSKSVEIKEFLKTMGVLFSAAKPIDIKGYKKNLLSVGVWSDEDLKEISEAREAINSIKPQEWERRKCIATKRIKCVAIIS